MKQTLHLVIALALSAGCGKSITPAQQMAYDRAVQETRMVLKYPDASEWPKMDKVSFTGPDDSLNVMFSVMAPNAFGMKSSTMTLITFKVDSCAHVLGGFVADQKLMADPLGAPCEFSALLDARRAYADSLEAVEDVRFQAQKDSLVEASNAAYRALMHHD